MTPWAIPGRYNRPICRRIVEAAGVPREAFGIRKKAASVLFFVEPPGLGPDARADWGRWVAEHADAWRTRGRRPPRLTARPATWQVIAQVGSRPLRALAAAAPRRLGFLRPLADRLAGLARHAPSFRDRKSTRLNSSHLGISYAVFCLKKKNKNDQKHI